MSDPSDFVRCLHNKTDEPLPPLIRPIPTLVALVKIRRQGAILVKD